jgi:hypothetical protein|tara:strand:+ start:1161 stop:1769 length:609 start_codon:yes stop_codon:yes gene_type:complete
MACDLTKGRKVDCKDSIGGLRTMYILPNYCGNIEASAEITDLEMTDADFADWDTFTPAPTNKQTLLQYDLRPNLSSLTVNFNSDPATGTTFFSSVLSVTLQKIDHDSTNQLKLAAYNRSQIFVRDAMDNIFLLGMNAGCNITSGTMVTGAAKGDLSGYTLEFTSEEKLPPIQIVPTAGPSATGYPWDNLSDYASIDFVEGTL